jgi:uncharacterized membrane protein YhaH (DUF805 family)
MSDAAVPTGPPPNPRIGRQRYLARALEVLMVLTVIVAGATLVLPGRAGEVAGTAMVAALIAAPVVRVGWLLVRWARLGDRRFALTAAALLGVLLVAALIR